MNEFNSILFLDFDGVLNCQLHYDKYFSHLNRFDNIPLYKIVKKLLRKMVKSGEISDVEYYKSQLCSERISLLNGLCEEINCGVVISSTWRLNKSVEELQTILNNSGASFKVIDKTSFTGYARGTEIKKWLYDNTEKYFNIPYYDFYRYVIIDDDNDYLIGQQHNLFQVDSYCGLTPTTCYKIKRFLTHETF